LREVGSKARAGGGGIHDVSQSEIKGGNAVNLAHALAKLGLRTLLITHTDSVHDALLREPFEGLDAEVRAKPKPPGLTVAFEERANVMLGEGGGAADFGPELLGPEDWESLKTARLVCSVNWAANRSGTRLLSELRKRLGRAKTIFFDPADVRDRLDRYRELLKLTRDHHLIDWMSLNEQEALATSKVLGVGGKTLEEKCLGIGRTLGIELDVHTEEGSMTLEKGKVVSFRSGPVIPKRLTGAGDVWGAATIYGRLKKIKAEERLRFANAAAAIYLRGREPVPPSLEQVLARAG
ncbi:MAG: carbohydrate kinase family protein, partial [Candidatus Gagatemarchaeaceae archaeon]